MCIFPFISACNEIKGDGVMSNASKPISGFTKIQVNIPAEVYYDISDNYLFEIKGEQNIIRNIETSISDNLLTITFKDQIKYNYRPTRPIIIRITSPRLNRVILNGEAHFVTNKTLKSGNLYCKLSGNSRAEFTDLLIDKLFLTATGQSSSVFHHLQSNDINIQLSGGSQSRFDYLLTHIMDYKGTGSSGLKVISGNCHTQKIVLNGTSILDASEFNCQNVYIKASGSSLAQFHCETELDIKASGTAKIEYSGSPNHQIFASTGAKVTQRERTPPIQTDTISVSDTNYTEEDDDWF